MPLLRAWAGSGPGRASGHQQVEPVQDALQPELQRLVPPAAFRRRGQRRAERGEPRRRRRILDRMLRAGKDGTALALPDCPDGPVGQHTAATAETTEAVKSPHRHAR
ncbi:hypothetical protein ACWGE1_19495 [Streptomyces sp. NPDC054932]